MNEYYKNKKIELENGFTMRLINDHKKKEDLTLDNKQKKISNANQDFNKQVLIKSELNKNMISNKLNEINHHNMNNLNEMNENSKNNLENFLVVLLNEGNTTYIVSVLQCLRNIRHLEKYYLNYLKDIENNLNNALISYVFSRVIYNLNPSQGKDKKKLL